MGLVKSSLRQSVSIRVWEWTGGLSGLASILSYSQSFFPQKPLWLHIIVFVAFCLLLVFLVFIYFLLVNTIKWIHNIYVDSIWGETIVDLANAYAAIHKLDRKEDVTEKAIAQTLGHFCDAVKKIFDRKTHSNCSVSIKVPISNYTESGQWVSMCVKNIARDQKHLSMRETVDYQNTKHDVISNTAYSRVVSLVVKESSKPRVYLNNKVKEDPNYATTSSFCKDREAIPYKSELVVPVIPSDYERLSDIKFGGFLCIDSDVENSFDPKRYDIPMTQGLADGLYMLIQKLIAKRELTIEK